MSVSCPKALLYHLESDNIFCITVIDIVYIYVYHYNVDYLIASCLGNELSDTRLGFDDAVLVT